jgi:DNA-binding response OmpR family regulator
VYFLWRCYRRATREVEPVVKVLVIEGEAPARAYLWAALRGAGHEVGEASDGSQGLRALRATAYDLVLCDQFLPGGEGAETIREIRRDHPALPVIALSGECPRRAADLLPATPLSAVGTISKPFQVAELLGAVTAALGRPAP